MSGFFRYVVDSFREVSENVHWPSRKSLQNAAVLVGVSCVLFSLVILMMDGAVGYLVDFIFSTTR